MAAKISENPCLNVEETHELACILIIYKISLFIGGINPARIPSKSANKETH